MPCLLCACGCQVTPKRCEQANHQVEYANEHAKLVESQRDRLQIAERRLDLNRGWVPDPGVSISSLSRIKEQASSGGESMREELMRRGAMQLVIGTIVAQRNDVNVQMEGFGALLAICREVGAMNKALSSVMAAKMLLGKLKAPGGPLGGGGGEPVRMISPRPPIAGSPCKHARSEREEAQAAEPSYHLTTGFECWRRRTTANQTWWCGGCRNLDTTAAFDRRWFG